MSKTTANRILSAAIAATLYASASYAQQPTPQAAPQAERSLDEVIVTGSYIRGTPEDAALPVDVISSTDLAEQGSPTVVQLVKTITASQSAIGESNRYNAGAGTAQINLRGFGAGRTLTLLNGRRMADNPLTAGQNLNFVPSAAVGRVEILKDGAAATYGSEAIGGVVNFITRTDLDGIEADAEYSAINGSDGDYQANLALGSKFENGNMLFTIGYRHRSRLDIHERDWALAPYEDPGYGGWTGAGNPGSYVVNSPATTGLFRDNGCSQLGGVLTTGAAGRPISASDSAATINAATCRFQFSTFNDLVNDEEHYQVYGEINTTLGDSIQSHTEVAWARDWVPMQRLSPANLTAQFPTAITNGGTSGSTANPAIVNAGVRYNVPAYNPGLLDLISTCATNPVAFASAGVNCTNLSALGGVDISQTGWRAIAAAGHPTNPDKADHQTIDTNSFRVSTGLKGQIFGDVDWDTALTYMNAHSTVNTNDLLVNRIQNGLNGYLSLPGSSNPCTAADQATLSALPAGPARLQAHLDAGCYFFNPFTNSVAVSAVNNQPNTGVYRGDVNPYVINNPQIVESLYGHYENEAINELFVIDAVVSGQTGLTLPGGGIGWALGGQYRYTAERNEFGDLFNNEVNPCVDSIDDDTPVCGTPAGPLIFFGSNNNTYYTRSVYAAFGELSLPVLDSLDVSLAARFEQYPGEIGSTFDPKISVRWQVLDWFALRGSASTTFRAPSSTNTNPECATGVANISGQYRAVENCGNADLVPETAEDYNVGFIFNPGNFTATVDYFLFKFEGELAQESAARMNATMFNITTATPNGNALNCGQAAYAALQARFQFTSSGCGAANTTRIQTYTVNGPDTETSGFDIRLQYAWDSVFGGLLSVGAEGTYLLEYKRGAFSLKDNPGTIIAAPEDRAGRHDLVAQFFSYPKLRANAFATYNLDALTFRWQTRFTDGTSAAFSSPTSRWVADASVSTGYTQELIGKTDAYWQHDLTVRWALTGGRTLTGSVQNILDEDPSDAPSQYNYDYTNGNPLGRVFEIGAQVKF